MPPAPLTPLERRAAFAHAVTMHETSKAGGSEFLGYSWTHIEAVMEGSRTPGDELRAKLAEYCGVDPEIFWGEAAPVAKVG